MKQSTGYVFKQGKVWIARITYADSDGKRKNLTRNAATKTEARELLDGMRQKLKDYGARPLDGERLKMSELIDAYVKARIIPAEYHGDRKVAGMRSHRAAKIYAESIKRHFGKKRVKDVTPTDVEEFKAVRLKTPTKRKNQRSITSVNRELELLRAIFAYARREGLILRSPFESLRGVVSKADERRRDRTLGFDEEKRLLDACDDPKRAHLRPILICALDTAMRKGEIIKLCWRDVYLDGRTILVTAMNSKTMKARTVGMTQRLHAELTRLWETSPKDLDVSVFGISEFKRAFATACELAGVEDFRFHDCRHTAITRWVRSGLSIGEVKTISGHSTLAALSIYINSTPETVRRGAAALDALRDQAQWDQARESESELIN